MNKRSLVKLLGLTVIVSLFACSVSEKTFGDAQKRMDALKAQGIPDSLLSPAKLFLRQAKDENFRKNYSVANKAAKDFKTEIAQVEKSYLASIPQIESEINALRGQVASVKSQVSGMQVMRIDTMMQKVDSLASKKLLPDALAKIKKVVEALPQIQKDQESANKVKSKVYGKWTCTNTYKHSEDPTVKAIEKKIFILNRDGTAKFIENKTGKSGPFLKEDYEYISTGTFDLLGDTVYLSINRFKAVKQNFSRMVDIKKKIWKPDNHPSYDSTITDKSQDRYVAYPDLLSDFVHSN